MLPMLSTLAAALAFVLAVAAVEPPGRGENCDSELGSRAACADGLVCREDDTYSDVDGCQGLLKEDAECDLRFECDAGLYCSNDNKCVRAKELGDSCQYDFECGASSQCGFSGDGPTCIELGAESEACAESWRCGDGLRCDEAT